MLAGVLHTVITMRLSIVAALAIAASLGAQPPGAAQRNIPIRPLGPITAVAKDTLGPRIITRGLSDGRVLVGVFAFQQGIGARRVKLFDSTLQHVTVLMDSSHMPQLIRYIGDSTLALEQPSQSLLVLDPDGKTARVMALPKARDFPNLVGFVRTPWVDPKGRLVYRANPPRLPPSDAPGEQELPSPDSAYIVRADFDARTVDTIATVRLGHPTRIFITRSPNAQAVRVVADPMAADDEWTMLPDGTIAIVRAQDYHIDWIDPDGTHRSSPRMPFDWKRLTDADKQTKIDSMAPALDSVRAQNPPTTEQGPNGPTRFTTTFEAIPAAKLADYEPAVGPGSVRSDLEGNVWIVPRTTAASTAGLLYDVVNRKGEIVERVQFPKGVALVGFGPGGVVYLNRVEGNIGFLERAKIR
jgi:hypothetical protein